VIKVGRTWLCIDSVRSLPGLRSTGREGLGDSRDIYEDCRIVEQCAWKSDSTPHTQHRDMEHRRSKTRDIRDHHSHGGEAWIIDQR